jgi:hypothetical protein
MASRGRRAPGARAPGTALDLLQAQGAARRQQRGLDDVLQFLFVHGFPSLQRPASGWTASAAGRTLDAARLDVNGRERLRLDEVQQRFADQLEQREEGHDDAHAALLGVNSFVNSTKPPSWIRASTSDMRWRTDSGSRWIW